MRKVPKLPKTSGHQTHKIIRSHELYGLVRGMPNEAWLAAQDFMHHTHGVFITEFEMIKPSPQRSSSIDTFPGCHGLLEEHINRLHLNSIIIRTFTKRVG